MRTGRDCSGESVSHKMWKFCTHQTFLPKIDGRHKKCRRSRKFQSALFLGMASAGRGFAGSPVL